MSRSFSIGSLPSSVTGGGSLTFTSKAASGGTVVAFHTDASSSIAVSLSPSSNNWVLPATYMDGATGVVATSVSPLAGFVSVASLNGTAGTLSVSIGGVAPTYGVAPSAPVGMTLLVNGTASSPVTPSSASISVRDDGSALATVVGSVSSTGASSIQTLLVNASGVLQQTSVSIPSQYSGPVTSDVAVLGSGLAVQLIQAGSTLLFSAQQPVARRLLSSTSSGGLSFGNVTEIPASLASGYTFAPTGGSYYAGSSTGSALTVVLQSTTDQSLRVVQYDSSLQTWSDISGDANATACPSLSWASGNVTSLKAVSAAIAYDGGDNLLLGVADATQGGLALTFAFVPVSTLSLWTNGSVNSSCVSGGLWLPQGVSNSSIKLSTIGVSSASAPPPDGSSLIGQFYLWCVAWYLALTCFAVLTLVPRVWSSVHYRHTMFGVRFSIDL